MKNRYLALSTVLACSLALGGCGLIPGGSDTRTVSIWLMQNSVSEDWLNRFTETFEKEHPGIELEVTFQEWTGIGKKVTEALRSDDAPEVIEVGNTQVAGYAESGGLRDLTLESVRDLGNEDWLPGLAEPGSVNGSQYGIPWYAANRVVIYNKELFAEAGITEPPRTRAEWLEISEKLDKPGQDGIYLSGQDWYTLAGFIWDEGGELAVERAGEWEGALHSKAALRGMKFYEELQAHGSGPKDGDEETPPQAEVFAKGNVAQMIAVPSAATVIEKANPELKGKLGFFPVPGKTAAAPGSVFIGGSDLIVPENSKERAAAVEVVSALAGDEWQLDLARTMNYVPNKATLGLELEGVESTSAMAAGAAQGRATPNSPQWAEVEVENPIKPYMTAVLQGQDPATAARSASTRITAALRP
ncbi:extracellular solute-binding protein [Streptomyces zhihengii]|uniref:Extracellular solute-binding protein n=1 Tax=Streptomyces zhihengii TaxID=1818004 RepID=A0ABS2V0N8_9ACTN|nr:extracellular solute-binding protein [Streptomyces zhihengii]MBM9623396.1 extracellular solute-binding protein [Streptomyces zhihengii]